MLKTFEMNQMTLAPAYEVLSTNSGQGFREFTYGKYGKESTFESTISNCEALRLDKEEEVKEVMWVIEVVNA